MKRDTRFNAIFDQAATGFALIDSNTGKMIKVNQRFCNILGLNNGAAEDTTFMAITHPDDLQEDLNNMQKLRDGEIRDFSMEKRYIKKDGSTIWGKLTVTALWDEGEEPDYHLAVVEDITEQKQAQQQLYETNKILDHILADHSGKLDTKTNELSVLEASLKKRDIELEEKNKNLLEMNTALKLFIEKKDELSEDIGLKILGTIRTAIEPTLQKLEKMCSDEKRLNCIKTINAHLEHVITPLPQKLAVQHPNLSRTETKVADLIKHGFANKEIASHLNVSTETISFHRKNIRRKLGLRNSETNLCTYLKNLT